MRTKGNAVIELLILLPVWLAITAGLLSLATLWTQRRHALQAARLGALLLSSSRVPAGVAEQITRDYLQTLENASAGDWNVRLDAFRDTAASRFYSLVAARIEGPFFLREIAVCQRGEDTP